MTSVNESQEHGHSHAGGYDVVIPPWVLWTIYGVVAAGCTWLAYDLYRERRKADQLAILVVNSVRKAYDTSPPIVSDEDKKSDL
jgi:hypothetical protein